MPAELELIANGIAGAMPEKLKAIVKSSGSAVLGAGALVGRIGMAGVKGILGGVKAVASGVAGVATKVATVAGVTRQQQGRCAARLCT